MKTQAVCVYFVWQEVSSSRELIWRRTWNTSAPTRQSRWRTWWCPRTRRCSAGWRSRRPAPESARSTSSPGTLSLRATLYRPSSNWMRNYWNGPRDFPPRICIILPLKKKKKKKCESQHEIHSSLFFFFYNSYRKKSTWIIHRHVDALMGGRKMYISVWKLLEKKKKKTDFLVFSTCTCLFTFSSLYMQCTVSVVTKPARWPVLCYGDQSNNYTPNLTLT